MSELNKKELKKYRKEVLENCIKRFNDYPNVYPKGITAEEFSRIVIKYILGPNYYISDPVSEKQFNFYALIEILEKTKNI